MCAAFLPILRTYLFLVSERHRDTITKTKVVLRRALPLLVTGALSGCGVALVVSSIESKRE